MNRDKETRDRLIESARREFFDKGYRGASLRTICGNAGVTTGALYFFFKGKEDLYAEIVGPAVDSIKELVRRHMELELMDVREPNSTKEDMRDDLFASRQIVHYMYSNYDVLYMLLTSSQGSRFENCYDEFVDTMNKGYRILADEQAKVSGVTSPDDYTIHWVAHQQLNAFTHLLLHERNEEEAVKHLDKVIKYLVAGWYAMFDDEAKKKD